mmetsp:Transcript_39061/g.90934  ORF Transcript_39061/g.90934 Transcript_39061/m.90934 type:complete len:237 (+) Transcript_39061:555-1265(+)
MCNLGGGEDFRGGASAAPTEAFCPAAPFPKTFFRCLDIRAARIRTFALVVSDSISTSASSWGGGGGAVSDPRLSLRELSAAFLRRITWLERVRERGAASAGDKGSSDARGAVSCVRMGVWVRLSDFRRLATAATAPERERERVDGTPSVRESAALSWEGGGSGGSFAETREHLFSTVLELVHVLDAARGCSLPFREGEAETEHDEAFWRRLRTLARRSRDRNLEEEFIVEEVPVEQ